MNRSAKLWFCSFNNAPVSLRGPLSPAPFLMSQWIFKWNKRPMCSAPSRHTKHGINKYARDGFWCGWQQMESTFKNCQIFLHFFAVWFFLGEDNNNKCLNIFVFLFHEFIKPIWFLSCPKHHRHKQACSDSAKVDAQTGMQWFRESWCSEEIYFLKHFDSCGCLASGQ